MDNLYDILVEHNQIGVGPKGSKVDSISTSPYCVVAVWRYQFPVTYSREKGESFSKLPTAAVEMRIEPLIIVDDLRTASVSCNKSSYIGQFQASLHPGMNYFQEIFPGDHLACWMVHTQELAEDLITRIRRAQTCNNFLDGLKFLGKVSGLRKNIVQNPTGVRTTSYSLNASSFTELDAGIYFDPHLDTNESRLGVSWLQKTGISIDNLITSGKDGYIDADDILSALLGIFYGKGVPKNQGAQDGGPRNTAGLDDPNAMIVPNPVAKMLGVTSGSKANGAFAYTDTLEFIHGIQKYSMRGNSSENILLSKQGSHGDVLNRQAADIFSPDSENPFDTKDRFRPTGKKLLASFLPQQAQFNGDNTVWSILQRYLNPTINEMYACLRVNTEGRVFPTLTARQLPFSSGLLSERYTPKPVAVANKTEEPKKKNQGKGGHQKNATPPSPDTSVPSRDAERNLTLTRFAELPRWYAHPILVRQLDIGRSDAVRFNFIHITSDQGYSTGNQVNELIRDPPIVDELDMYRNGLRTHISTVNTSAADTMNRKNGDWMYILSDILMGQHLMLSGQISLLGVQAPICPGDNLEFDKHIFHIEGLTHTFSIQQNGVKSFYTTLSLTHGVRIEQLAGKDLSLYTGAAVDDLAGYDAPVATEYTMSPTSPSMAKSEGVAAQDKTEEEGLV